MSAKISKESFDKLQRIEDQLKTDRQRRERTWKEVAAHTNPDMAAWNDEPAQKSGKSQDTTVNIYDTTARKDSLMLATGMQTYGYPKGNPWFKLELEGQDDLTDAEATWLEMAERKIYADFQKSNFYDEGISFGKCCADFGTSVAMCIDDTYRKVPIFKTQHLKWSVIAENQFGEVDVLMREMWLTPFEAAEKFSYQNLPKQVQDAYREGKMSLWKFFQYIVPIDRYDLDIDKPKNRAFYSVFGADCDRSAPLMDGGYAIKPFFAWRWSRSIDGDVWGVDSPGLLELPTIKQLNSTRADLSRIVQKMARPSIKATESLKGRINLQPDGITFLGRGEDYVREQGLQRPEGVFQDMADLRAQVDSSYYVDFLLTLSRNIDKQKTATEVAGIQSERALLSSFYGRMDAEFLEPAIEYEFSLGIMSGRIPPPPESLRGKDLRVDMVSPLAQMQRRYLKVGASQQALGEILALSQVNPQILDNFDFDQHVRNIADAFGLDKRVVRDMVDVQKLRQALAQIQAQMVQQQQRLETAKVGAEVMSKVPKEEA